MKWIKSFCILLIFYFSFSSVLLAEDATSFVKAMLEKVMDIQTDPSLKNKRNLRRRLIKKIIQKNFDLDLMTKNSLGAYWKKLSKEEKKEFRSVFPDLFQESYTKMVLDFLKREKISYDREIKKKNETVVETRIVKMQDEIPVTYHLLKKGRRWYVFDVEIDGVSIVENYRRSFSRIIRRKSFQYLLKKMKLQQKAIKEAYGK